MSGQSRPILKPMGKALEWLDRQLHAPGAGETRNETQRSLTLFLLTTITLYGSPMSIPSAYSLQDDVQMDSFPTHILHLHRQVPLIILDHA